MIPGRPLLGFQATAKPGLNSASLSSLRRPCSIDLDTRVVLRTYSCIVWILNARLSTTILVAFRVWRGLQRRGDGGAGGPAGGRCLTVHLPTLSPTLLSPTSTQLCKPTVSNVPPPDSPTGAKTWEDTSAHPNQPLLSQKISTALHCIAPRVN